MAEVTLNTQALITVDEALAYLQDQGSAVDDNDLLRTHINGVSALMLMVTGMDKLKWVDGEQITEIRDGCGIATIWTLTAPLVEVVSVTLYPNQDSSVSITVPVAPALYSDDMYFESRTGLIVLKNRTFPDGPGLTKIVYEAGYLSTDHEFQGLKMIALDALAAKWKRWKDQKHGIASENRGETSISYTTEDFDKNAMKDLRRYRRNLFA